MEDAACCFPKYGLSDLGRTGQGWGHLASVSSPLVSSEGGREGGNAGYWQRSSVVRDEHWAESQGCGFWSCSALNLLFDLGLSPSPP